MQLNWEFLTSIVQILVIDVVLSGDNAVVIAMAAHRLPQRQRKIAVLFGAGCAILLRVLFTWVLAKLLDTPLLRFGGGIALVWIAVKLLMQESAADHKVREGGSLIQAIWIIVMADLVMSLDNMLAVGGASEGSAALILFGLLLSIAIIMTCSVFIAEMMNRFPILVVLGAAVLAWTAGEMMVEDAKVAEFVVTRSQTCVDASWHGEFGGNAKHPEPAGWWIAWAAKLTHSHWIGWAVVVGSVAFVVVFPIIWNLACRRPPAASATAEGSKDPTADPPADVPPPASTAPG